MNIQNQREQFLNELDRLCQQRTADYPARREAHFQLTEKLKDFCHWLQAQQDPAWQPDPTLVQTAKSLTPIFICGYQKSGTTFIRDLLDGHESLSILPGDATLFRTWQKIQLQHATLAQQKQELRERWIHRLVNPTGLPPFWLFGRDVEPYLTFLNYLDYWFDHITHPIHLGMTTVALAFYCANPYRPSQAHYWVDKTPLQEMEVDFLQQNYPQARYIHVIRNPLASLAARKKMAQSFGYRFTLLSHIDLFQESLKQGLKFQHQLGPQTYIITRYEDVLNNPLETMTDIATTLDLAYSPILTQPTINSQPSTPNSAYKENRQAEGIQKRSLDKWKTILTPVEVTHIVDTLSPEATAYGYQWPQPALLPKLGLRLVRQGVRTLRRAWHLLPTKAPAPTPHSGE